MNKDLSSSETAELRRELDRLRVVERRFRLLVESVRDCALFSIDNRGDIIEWTPGAQQIFGYSAPEVLHRSFFELFAPDSDTKNLLKSELEVVAREGGASAEAWLARKDGSRFYARWVTNAVRDEGGQIAAYTKILGDDTEHKRRDEQREQQFQRDCELFQSQIRFTALALNRTKEELETLAGQLLHAQDVERQAIARDLHDHLAQRLAVLGMQVDQLRTQPPISATQLQLELKGIQEQLSELSSEVRDLSHRLHPSVLEHVGLLPALRSLIKESSSGRTKPIQLDASNFFEEGLSVAVRGALYRITEEALRNVRKHAGDVLVTVRVDRGPGEVRLEIEDQGPGFSQDGLDGKRTLGLISMRERARLLGGTFDVSAAPGKGTKISVCLPLTASQ